MRKERTVRTISKYNQGKEKWRTAAIEWQADFENHNYSWSELFHFQKMFEYYGKQFGLLKEFRENGII